jgi:hypothetical protein
MRTVVKTSIFGIALTLLLLACTFAADSAGHPSLAQGMFWQNGLLQSAVPLNSIGAMQEPVYEGTPLNIMAFFASIPLGFIIYGVAAYVALRFLRLGT